MFEMGSAAGVLLLAVAAAGLWFVARRTWHQQPKRIERRHLHDRRAGNRGTSELRRDWPPQA